MQMPSLPTQSTTFTYLNIRNSLPWLMVGCGFMIMTIWPIVETIAMRNVVIYVGGFIGLAYILQERSTLYQRPALPLFFILLFFIWVVLHFFMFSQNKEVEFAINRGHGLRIIFVCVLGMGVGMFARKQPRAQQAVWLSLLMFVIFSLLTYLWLSYSKGIWAIPYPDLSQFSVPIFKTEANYKLNPVFYGTVSLALCSAVISYRITQNGERLGGLFLPAATISMVILLFLITDTKNGIVNGLVLLSFLSVIALLKVKKTISNTLIVLTFLAIIIGLLQLKPPPEWQAIAPTFIMGQQIDKTKIWQAINESPPKLADGSVGDGSLYARTTLATAGLKLLREQPFGYGLVDISISHLLNIPGQTFSSHSAWLDFSLAFGIPGLLLIWITIALAVYYSFKRDSLWAYATRWILAGVFIARLFAELGSAHFAETMFYLIALFSAGNLPDVTITRKSDRS